LLKVTEGTICSEKEVKTVAVVELFARLRFRSWQYLIISSRRCLLLRLSSRFVETLANLLVICCHVFICNLCCSCCVTKVCWIQ